MEQDLDVEQIINEFEQQLETEISMGDSPLDFLSLEVADESW